MSAGGKSARSESWTNSLTIVPFDSERLLCSCEAYLLVNRGDADRPNSAILSHGLVSTLVIAGLRVTALEVNYPHPNLKSKPPPSPGGAVSKSSP